MSDKFTTLEKTKKTKPELLAPAGDWACMKAAVLNGADAVYFGLSDFNARRRAANFGIDELPAVMDYLHSHNIKGYVTFNTLVFSSELENAAAFLKAIAAAGCDAVIVQDIGAVLLLSRLVPSLPIHASTQMTLTDAGSVKFVKTLGVARAIMARELSITELRQIHTATDVELEAFAHGALCISYSGQCLASLTLGGRSANRGVCAQPCRMPYQLIVNDTPFKHDNKKYVLSPTDLAAYERLGAMMEAGVRGFKIEGRLKNEYYVAAAVAAYRSALDAAIEGKPFTLSPEQHARLVQGFSRGFTTGHLDGKDHVKLVHGRFPKSRGMYLGTVEAKGISGLTIAFAAENTISLKAGDGVVIDCGGPESDQGGRIYMVKAAGTGKAALMFGKGDINLAKVAIGAPVWKTDDPAVRKQIEQTFNIDKVVHPARINIRICARLGENLVITVRDDSGHSTQAAWEQPLEAAQNYALSEESIREQFGRLGGTPFVLGDIAIEQLDAVMVPRSVLNDLRRKAVDALTAMRKQGSVRAVADADALANIRTDMRQSRTTRGQTEIALLVRTIEQFETTLDYARSWRQIAMIYCDFIDTDLNGFAVAKARRASMPIALATLRIIKPGDDTTLAAILECRPDAVLARNLAAIAYFRNAATAIELVADLSLNIVNELAASVLAQRGIATITTSYDMSIEQLRNMLNYASPAWFEQIIYDHVPMFHTEHCVAANMLAGAKDSRSCGKRCENGIKLEDTKFQRYRLDRDPACRTTIYHPAVFSAAMQIEALKTMGLRRFRIGFCNEDAAATRAVLENFSKVFGGMIDAGEAMTAITTATRQKFTAAPLVR